MLKVNIGVTTYNGADRLLWLLQSIIMRTPELMAGEVVVTVVDDGSPRPGRGDVAGALAAIGSSASQSLRLIRHNSNRGISAGWNTATRATDAPICVLANDDVVVSDGWLAALVYALDHSPGVGVVGANWHAFLPEDVPGLLSDDCQVVPRDPLTKKQDPSRRQFEDTWPGRVMAPTGQLFAFRRVDFDKVGGFDEEYKSFYEESCFSTSMAAKLGKIGLQLTWPFNYHLWSATFGQNPELSASERMTASRAHYRRKWGVPEGVHEFEFTNPKYLGAIGDVPVEFLRRDGPWRGVLRRDGAFVDGEKI